jgi:hypothetical protein
MSHVPEVRDRRQPYCEVTAVVVTVMGMVAVTPPDPVTV